MSNCQDVCQTISRRYDDLLSTDRIDLSNTHRVIVLVWLGAVRSATPSVQLGFLFFLVPAYPGCLGKRPLNECSAVVLSDLEGYWLWTHTHTKLFYGSLDFVWDNRLPALKKRQKMKQCPSVSMWRSDEYSGWLFQVEFSEITLVLIHDCMTGRASGWKKYPSKRPCYMWWL